jgi:hypothetical protein
MITLQEIYNGIANLFPGNRFGKIQSLALEMLNSIEEDLYDSVTPALDMLLDQPEILKDIDKSKTFTTVKSALGAKNFESLLRDCKNYSTDVTNNLQKLEQLVKANLNNSLNSKTMNYKQYSTYSLIEDIKINLIYMLKLIFIIMRDEKHSVLPQKGITKIVSMAPSFKQKVLSKATIKSLIETIESLPTDSIYDQVSSGAPEAAVMSGINPNMAGFVGNPILRYRKWLVEREFAQIEYLKQLKSVIELRLLELRNQAAGGTPDSKLQGQIEYYEDKLASIDAKIEKLQSLD